jgi:serine/threonine protein kinase
MNEQSTAVHSHSLVFVILVPQKLTLQLLTEAYLDGFTREASLQRELQHPNVVQFLGVYFDPPRLGIVMEYCANGSLFHVLKVGLEPSRVCSVPTLALIPLTLMSISLSQARRENNEKMNWTKEQFHPIKIAIDIAKGMQYLQSLKLIHRDLKSLNVLIDEKWNAKVLQGHSSLCSFLTHLISR